MSGTASPQDGGISASLREATRRSRGAVLISTGCLGRCELSALMLLAWRHQSPPAIALAGMHQPARMRALARWIPGPGPRKALFERQIEAGAVADAIAEGGQPQLLPPNE